jgi:hypothetical protein
MLASPHTDHNAFCAKCLFVGGMLLISARLVNSQRVYASLDLQGLFNLWVSFFLYLWSQSPLMVPTLVAQRLLHLPERRTKVQWCPL